MIPQADIMEWRTKAPWGTFEQVEQDLVISRAVVMLFSNDLLADQLAFRGGTAMHKMHLGPAARYSEDIDLVQLKAGKITPVQDAIRGTLDGLLGKPRRSSKQRGTTLEYHFPSETPPVVRMRLKLEINTREHFSVLGITRHPFAVESRWFSGTCNVPTYPLNELLGTKLRALYQRNKGRDLFDLWYGITIGKADPSVIVKAFRKYLEAEGRTISQKDLRGNLAAKMEDRDFLGDVRDLLRPDVAYDHQQAYAVVDQQVLALL